MYEIIITGEKAHTMQEISEQIDQETDLSPHVHVVFISEIIVCDIMNFLFASRSIADQKPASSVT